MHYTQHCKLIILTLSLKVAAESHEKTLTTKIINIYRHNVYTFLEKTHCSDFKCYCGSEAVLHITKWSLVLLDFPFNNNNNNLMSNV